MLINEVFCFLDFGTVVFGISFRFFNESVNKNQNLPHVIEEKINKVPLGFFSEWGFSRFRPRVPRESHSGKWDFLTILRGSGHSHVGVPTRGSISIQGQKSKNPNGKKHDNNRN